MFGDAIITSSQMCDVCTIKESKTKILNFDPDDSQNRFVFFLSKRKKS